MAPPTLPHTGADSDDTRSITSKASLSEREEKPDLERGMPVRKPTIGINFGTTEADDDAARRFKRERTLERQHSINSINRPRADPASRLAIGYRTMSIQLSEGGLADGGGKKKEKRALKDIADMDWHTLPVDDVLSRLGVAPQNGLDAQQAQRRLGQYGPNQMSKPQNKYFKKVLGYVFGGFGVLLFSASIICFIAWKPLGNPAPQVSNLALAIVLLFVVLLTSVFNMWQDFSTSRVMASIAGMLPSDVLVVRDGTRTSIPATQLTRGDIVVLSMGQKMAADMRVISITSELKFDRSALTGESDAINASVDKTDDNYLESRNVVMAGTSCVSGSGLGIVTQTGDTTVFGRLAKLSSAPKVGRTPLQKEVFYFVITIASLAATLATICVIIWAAFLRVKHPGFMSVSQLLVNVVSIVVAFLPEGVPICVTLSLTAIAAKLRKSRVLAKSLTTVETLGSVNVLCSDKTGTLTQNKMWVQSCGMLGLESTPTDASKHVTLGAPVGAALSQLAHVGAICNAATFDASTLALPLSQRKIHGDATDTACLRASEEIFGVDAANAGWETMPGGKLAFNSKTKFAAQLMSSSATSNAERLEQTLGAEAKSFQPADNLLLLVKGAPDVLLKRCTEVLDAAGESVKLTAERQASLVAMQENWASQGMRVLLFARRIVKRSAVAAQGNVAEQELLDLTVSLTVVGLVGIVDPPRPEIPHVVKTCRGAGLRFFMVTGDFESTALAIARQVGIVTAEKVLRFDDIQGLDFPAYDFLADNDAREQRALCLTGSDIMRLQPQDWNAVCAMDEICFARTTPEQKLRIVKEFQQRDGVLAMTGDGVNDAPALKAAEVGIAMGGGSEVAMEAADLILLGDFSSILDALLYGRLCFDNLRKSIAYLLPAGSMSELIPVLLSFFVGLPQVLSNLQMIFICCLTDVAPALALVQEKPEANLLARKPRSVKHDRLVDWRTLLHSYLFVGVPYSLVSSALAFSYMARHGIPFSDMFLKYGGGRVQTESPELFAEVLNQANSIYFWSLISMQWFNLFAVRTRRLSIFQQLPFGKPETRNMSLLPAIIISLAAGLVVSYPAPLQRVFLTRPIDGMSIGISIACGLGLLMVDEVRKLCVRTWPKSYFPGRIAW